MEDCMKDSMRKLALWNTRTFKPIMTHEDLEPIMSILGFVGVSPSAAWKEYVYTSGTHACCRMNDSQHPPKPKLPYPRVDGLHNYTYTAFLDAVQFYMGTRDVCEIFHIRGMPLHRVHDGNKKWRRMEEDENIFVYREGTLDQTTYNHYHFNGKQTQPSSNGYNIQSNLRKKGHITNPLNCIVPLKDIICTADG